MDYRQIAARMAQQYGVDPNLYARLITQESNWNPNAVSRVGARGIAQIMPATAVDPGFGVRPVQMGNVEDELRFGAEYLRAMMDYFEGDTTRALAAYNWGAGNVERWDGDLNSLPEETRNYIQRVGGMGSGSLRMSTKGQPDTDPPVTPLRPSTPILQSTLPDFLALTEDELVSDGSEQIALIEKARNMDRPSQRTRNRAVAPPVAIDARTGLPMAMTPPALLSENLDQNTGLPMAVPPPALDPIRQPPVLSQFQGPSTEDPRIIADDAMIAIGRPTQGPPVPPPAALAPTEEILQEPGGDFSQVSSSQPALITPADEVPLDQSNGGGFLSWLMPNMSDADRRQNLLAIGAGLLSGEDWSEGFALAGQNLAQAGQARMGRDSRIQEMLLQGELDSRLVQQREAAAGPDRLVPIGNIQDVNGNFVPNVWADPYTGQQFSVAPDGTRTPVQGFEVNNSTFAGTDQQRIVSATVDRLRSTRASLSVIDSALQNMDDVKQGLPGIIQSAQIHLQTFLNSTNLSEEQVSAMLARGDIQGLIGQIREQVVGPGVMTEQDAMRVVAYIGSDLRNFGGNRAVAEERLRQLRSRFERSYNEDWSLYEQARQKFGNTLLIPEIERMELGSGGALDSSNTGQTLPAPEGVDPELWKHLTPEEQREFIGG